MNDSAVAVAISRLDAWLDAMRGPDGYGGPVAHWWRDSLLFCGAGLDWRYEGIIRGYVTLSQSTRDQRWLAKARRAGDDLVTGQLPDSRYRNSRFEQNPGIGGTPHEAAADLALLVLADALRETDQPEWNQYLEAAQRNLVEYHIGSLWTNQDRRFSDGHRAFVPNKAATIIEALCFLAAMTGHHEYLERYVLPTAESILAHQVREPGNALDGAISQATINNSRIDQFFPYYIARCIPGLIAAYRALEDPRYLEAARSAGAFMVRWRDEDGAYPQVVYLGGRLNRYPRWIAATGDIIRALELLRPLGLDVDVRRTTDWLLAGQLPTGAVRIADGFAVQVQQRGLTEPPDVRDLLPVVGWNDKAFNGLTTLLSPGSSISAASPNEVEFRQTATWRSFGGRGQSVQYREDAKTVEVVGRDAILYRWRKGESWASARSPAGKARMNGL